MDETTLPSPDDHELLPGVATAQWSLVLAFHPDTARIGECWRGSPAGPLLINRHHPVFSATDGASAGPGRPLVDPRIGRDVVQLIPERDVWCLQRVPGRCRLRVDGTEITDAVRLDPERLRRGIVLLLGNCVLLHLRLVAEAPWEREHEVAIPGLIGVSAAARRLRRELRQAATGTGDVLLLGPTGSGKEVAAQAIHRLGRSPGAPWVAVNMSVLTQELAAADLFGARRGAFTGAERDRPGYFQQATGGTLFLDEIGDTPATVQPLLLRALQQRELQVVGGAVEKIELRVVAATEIDQGASEGGLRSSLRFRLGEQEIRLPPLHERREDIALIAASALDRAAAEGIVRWGTPGSAEREQLRWARCFELLLLRDWPGNIRELISRVQEIINLSAGGLSLPDSLLQGRQITAPVRNGAAAVGPSEVREMAPELDIKSVSDTGLAAVWHEEGGEVSRIARRFGVPRQTIYRRRRGVPGCRLADEIPQQDLLNALERCGGDVAAAARELSVSPARLRERLRAGRTDGDDGRDERGGGDEE